MGVKDLWAILAPAMVPVPLADLKGQTLAVDLSIWIVETQGVRQMQGVVTKPYLRNLFFRINHLLQLGINLIFVIEGEAPKLKWETMAQRTQVRYGAAGRGRGNTTTQKPPTRSHFNAVIKECCHLLDAIGVPYVQSAGEAEAKCAFLNAKGIVNGCLTDDGDVFLYGARKVYRNFSMKESHIESYDMADIEEKLDLELSHLVALGLLLGCDYVPKGVPGVGREMALKFFKHIGNENVLERFDIWVKNKMHYAQLEATSSAKKPSHCSQCRHPGTAREHDRKGCTLCHSSQHCEPQPYDYICPCNWHNKQQEVSASAVELNIQKRAIQTNGFPWPKVVEEFLTSKDKVPRNHLSWHCPKLNPFIRFCETKMEWVEDYSREKLLPLMTLWGMRAQLGIYDSNGKQFLEPHCIVKPRVRSGVACFEVQWQKLAEDCTFKEDHYTTIEDADIFEQCFPETVVMFEARKPVKTKRKPAKAKDKVGDKENVDISDVTLAISDMKLSDEKEKPFGRSTAEQMEHKKVVHLESEQKTTIQPNEVCKGNKVRTKQSVNEDENKALAPLHEQNMTWKETKLSEPFNPLNSEHLDMHKANDELQTLQPSLYHQNCSGLTTQCIESVMLKSSDLKSSTESSSDGEEYLPLSQRLALLPKINKKSVDVKPRQTSFVYRVNQKSTNVKVKPGIEVKQRPIDHIQFPTTDREAVVSGIPQNENCDKSNISEVVIENQLDFELVFDNTNTGSASTVISEDCSFRNRSMQVTTSMSQTVEDKPPESELVCLLKECSLENTPAVLDEDTTGRTITSASSSEGNEIKSSSSCKDHDKIVKTKDSGIPCTKDIRGAVNAREYLGKQSEAAARRKKLIKGKVRKSSKPWYTESVLDFSSDDDLVFDLHGDDRSARIRDQTYRHTESKNIRGSQTDDAEMILEKYNCINNSKPDGTMRKEESNITGTLYQDNNIKDVHDTKSMTTSYTKKDTEDIREEEIDVCTTKQNVSIMGFPEEYGRDTSASGNLEQSVEKGTYSVLEGGFIREDTINVTGGPDDIDLSQLEGGFFRERTGSFLKEISSNDSNKARIDPEEQAPIQTDNGPSTHSEAHLDSRNNSYINNSVQDTSFELSATDLFENSSKNDHEWDVTSSVKNYSFLNETPTIVFIDTPFSSPISGVTTGMKSLHEIVESPKLITSGMEGPVATTAANCHVTWNKSQFGDFNVGCTILDITCGSDKPDTSRCAADTYSVSPVQNSNYAPPVWSDLGSADQSLSPSTPNGVPCGTMSSLTANGAPCDMMSPSTANSAADCTMSPIATKSASNDVVISATGDNVGQLCGARSLYTVKSVRCSTISPTAAHSALCDVLNPLTANSTLTDVTSAGTLYEAMSPASSGSTLYDTRIAATGTCALTDTISPASGKVLSDAKMPISTSSPADTSVFAAASPIPLAQRLMKRVGSHLLTQFSQPSQSLRTLSHPRSQQSLQYGNTQSLKSKSIDFDDSDITLLDTE